MTDGPVPTLLLITGPPAVGKVTVGQAVADLTGYPLFHNHMAIEPVLRVFPWGTPAFGRIVGAFRRHVFEEVAASDLPGMVTTYVWAFGEPGEAETVAGYTAPFRARGGRVVFLELRASQDVRLTRNAGPDRLAEKPSKRDVEWSNGNLREMDAQYELNSDGSHYGDDEYLIVDNTELSAKEVAELAVEHFGLPRKVPAA